MELNRESSEAHGFKSLNELGMGADVTVYAWGVNGIGNSGSLVSARLRLANNSSAAVRIFGIKLWEGLGADRGAQCSR